MHAPMHTGDMSSRSGEATQAEAPTAGAEGGPAAAGEAASASASTEGGGFRKKPVVLLFMGMAGSGKTTLVQRLNLYLNEQVRFIDG